MVLITKEACSSWVSMSASILSTSSVTFTRSFFHNLISKLSSSSSFSNSSCFFRTCSCFFLAFSIAGAMSVLILSMSPVKSTIASSSSSYVSSSSAFLVFHSSSNFNLFDLSLSLGSSSSHLLIFAVTPSYSSSYSSFSLSALILISSRSSTFALIYFSSFLIVAAFLPAFDAVTKV